MKFPKCIADVTDSSFGKHTDRERGLAIVSLLEYTDIVCCFARIIHNTMFEGHLVVGMFPMYYLYNCLLCVLQGLHVIWFYMILRMFSQWLILGKAGCALDTSF